MKNIFLRIKIPFLDKSHDPNRAEISSILKVLGPFEICETFPIDRYQLDVCSTLL